MLPNISSSCPIKCLVLTYFKIFNFELCLVRRHQIVQTKSYLSNIYKLIKINLEKMLLLVHDLVLYVLPSTLIAPAVAFFMILFLVFGCKKVQPFALSMYKIAVG